MWGSFHILFCWIGISRGISYEFFFPNQAMKGIMITYEFEGENKYDEEYDGGEAV